MDMLRLNFQMETFIRVFGLMARLKVIVKNIINNMTDGFTINFRTGYMKERGIKNLYRK